MRGVAALPRLPPIAGPPQSRALDRARPAMDRTTLTLVLALALPSTAPAQRACVWQPGQGHSRVPLRGSRRPRRRQDGRVRGLPRSLPGGDPPDRQLRPGPGHVDPHRGHADPAHPRCPRRGRSDRLVSSAGSSETTRVRRPRSRGCTTSTPRCGRTARTCPSRPRAVAWCAWGVSCTTSAACSPTGTRRPMTTGSSTWTTRAPAGWPNPPSPPRAVTRARRSTAACCTCSGARTATTRIPWTASRSRSTTRRRTPGPRARPCLSPAPTQSRGPTWAVTAASC